MICPIMNSGRKKLEVEPMIECSKEKCEWWEKATNTCVVRALYNPPDTIPSEFRGNIT